MLYIEKKAPPPAYQAAVAALKSTPAWRAIQDDDTQAIRAQFDLLPKPEIRAALAEEQHHLCAYCMRRIRHEEEGAGAVHMRIEHWRPLSQGKAYALDYKNLLGVCTGGADTAGPKNRVLCCDASKGAEVCLTVDPLDKKKMAYIAYRQDGTIYCPSTDPMAKQIEYELNEVLCLNGRDGQDTATELVKGRRDAYQKARDIYKDLSRRKQLTSAQIDKKIQQIRRLDVYPEFVGTLLFVLERKRKLLASQGK